MKSDLSAFRLLLAVVVVDVLLAFWRPSLARDSAVLSVRFLGEVASIVPSVMVLMGLLDVWLPKRFVESRLGRDSGALGAALALLLGTAAAGPLYAAFPVAVSLQRKGARLSNVVVFLGAWGTIKLPMILMESSFVGLRFALLRLAFTVPCVLAMGWLMERMISVPARPAAETSAPAPPTEALR